MYDIFFSFVHPARGSDTVENLSFRTILGITFDVTVTHSNNSASFRTKIISMRLCMC